MDPTDEDIWKLADHAANLIYILEFHEKLGTTHNAFIRKELKRAHDTLIERLEREHYQGGRFEGQEIPE